MHNKRIIGSIILKNNFVVQSIDFEKYLPIGSLKFSLEFLDRWGIDEILLLDIDATRKNRKFDLNLFKKSN